jgi:hypothetical protein
LYFVNKHWRGKTLHEKSWIIFGEIQNQWIIKRYIRSILIAQVPEEGRFANLPRSSDEHDRDLGGGLFEEAF